jgi:hypothetical protein
MTLGELGDLTPTSPRTRLGAEPTEEYKTYIISEV